MQISQSLGLVNPYHHIVEIMHPQEIPKKSDLTLTAPNGFFMVESIYLLDFIYLFIFSLA
jgi:hypothetical protein